MWPPLNFNSGRDNVLASVVLMSAASWVVRRIGPAYAAACPPSTENPVRAYVPGFEADLAGAWYIMFSITSTESAKSGRGKE
jgi:hypothetical protein